MVKDPSKYFYVCDGSVLKSMADFKKGLKNMPDAVYEYHAQRGDWSNWVSGVLRKKDIATKLAKADTKKKAQRILK